MRPMISNCRLVVLSGVVFFSGCTTKTATEPIFPTGYLINATYITKSDLPAIVYGSGTPSRTDVVEFLRYAKDNDTGGKVEVIGAGTRILIQNVTIEDDPELGYLVRIFAKVTSGPHRDASANLYSISIRERRADGRSGLLKRDPTVLEELNL